MFKDCLETALQFILPKKGLTHLAGLLAEVRSPVIKDRLIRFFIRYYGVDMKEAVEEDPKRYSCFNTFFIRHLKPECRPLAKASIVSPVDGVLSALGRMREGQILEAKSRYYTVSELLACELDRSEPFRRGSFATFYLSPKDYHRIHMPIDARLKDMIYVPGKLFSVQPSTVRMIPRLLTRNERLVCFFDTHLGPMAMVLVGATIVGAIGTRWQGELIRSKEIQYLDPSSFSAMDLSIKQGDEMGYFKLGSTVVLLFAEEEQIRWREEVKIGIDVRYGQAFAD